MTKTVLYIILLTMNIGFCQSRNYAGQPYAEPDLLIWESDTIQIQTFPLYSLSDFEQKNLFENKEVKPECWGCIKNYTAEWKIINRKLYLSNIYSFNYKKDSIKTDLNKLFPDKIKDNLVLANWYSGNLFVPKGEHIWMSQSPGFPIYESEWEIIISKGIILHNKLKKNNYYQSIYTKNPDSLRIFIFKHIDWNKIPVIENEKDKVFASIKTGKNKTDFTISVKSKNEKLSIEVTRVLQLLPEFDYYYRHGEFLKMGYTFPIVFNKNMRPK